MHRGLRALSSHYLCVASAEPGSGINPQGRPKIVLTSEPSYYSECQQDVRADKSREGRERARGHRHSWGHILVSWDLFLGACHFCSFETVDLATF